MSDNAQLAFQTLHGGHFHQTLHQLTGIALVLFGQPGCGTCRHVEQQLPVVADKLVQHLLKVDVQRDPAIGREFNLFHLPALFIYRDGHFHAELQCEMTRSALAHTLMARLTEPAQEAP
ncbi:thioredoxin family protein [Chitinivorax sp. B]|uniref:thioredoxin family protein n=1 Tax=Chitinivorax sp. B TaxID=2502235 RepID=UPI0010F67899|nr:thioredoxin family protein [Chitinivorax sp. B]